MDLVQRHVVRAPGIVIGQKMGHIMVDVPAQDLQAPHNHATQKAAQVRKNSGLFKESFIVIIYS